MLAALQGLLSLVLGVCTLLPISPGAAGSDLQMRKRGSERLSDSSRITQMGEGRGLAPHCLSLVLCPRPGHAALGTAHVLKEDRSFKWAPKLSAQRGGLAFPNTQLAILFRIFGSSTHKMGCFQLGAVPTAPGSCLAWGEGCRSASRHRTVDI